MAASPIGRFDCIDGENPYSDGIVRLAWGEAPDGTMRHIIEVPSGLACGCRCPGCGTALVAHKGPIQQHHFAHKATADCRNAGQTALHKLAKEVLDRERRLLIPEIRAQVEDETILDHPGGLYTFDDARLERRLGDVVPDVIVRKAGHELLIEVAVTHFCDEEKVGRIRRLGIAAIEIDLSELPRNAHPDIVRQAILASAPREWIFNPRRDHTEEVLRDRIKRRRQAVRSREERRINHLVNTVVERAEQARMTRADATVRQVEEEGYAHAIGIAIPGDYCFRISRHRWQAWILDAFVLGPARRDGSWGPIQIRHVLRWIRKARLLRRELSFVGAETAAELNSHVSDYQDPLAVVETYLKWLEGAGILERSGRDWDASRAVTDHYREMARMGREREERYFDVIRAVDSILQNVPADEKASFEFDEWLGRNQPGYGASFAAALETGRDPWSRMSWALRKVERMMRFDGEFVDDLLALPIERARDREIERRRGRAIEQQRAREEAALKEADDRDARLKQTAVAMLGTDAIAWIDQPLSDGVTPRAVARSGKDGAERAFAALDREARRREDERASAALAQGRVEILRDGAIRILPAERVPVFMDSYHPKIRARPREHAARSDKGLQDCLALLPVSGRH